MQIVACVVGDGESETGPLATSWHGHRFLNPAAAGAVLPVLHLDGYKIANPAVLARIPDDELDALLRGYGYGPVYVSGHEPSVMHEKAAVLARPCPQRPKVPPPRAVGLLPTRSAGASLKADEQEAETTRR